MFLHIIIFLSYFLILPEQQPINIPKHIKIKVELCVEKKLPEISFSIL